MAKSAKNPPATIIPAMRYRDAPRAIEWLCQAFGFEKHLVVPDGDGSIAHTQLTYRNGMIVVDIKDEDYGGPGYSCRDPEGHLWKFGTYDSWASR